MEIPRPTGDPSRFVRFCPWFICLLVAAALLLDPCSARATPLFAAVGEISGRTESTDTGVAQRLPSALDCDSPLPLALGDVITGDTTGIPSEVDQYGCVSYLELGGEIVYRLEITTPVRFEITVESSADLDVVILSGCDPLLDCLALGDTGVRTTLPVTGTYYVVVDGYMNSEGPFTLQVQELIETEVPQEACENTIPLTINPYDPLRPWLPRRSYEGTLCGTDNQVDGLLCAHSPAPGTEDFFKVPVEAGGSIRVSLSMSGGDAVLWILGGCGAQTSCLVYADNDSDSDESKEEAVWVNSSSETHIVYLVVDQGILSSGCHGYSVSVSGQVAVPTESASWSILKTSFGANSTGGARP